jgi:hypothetical protein
MLRQSRSIYADSFVISKTCIYLATRGTVQQVLPNLCICNEVLSMHVIACPIYTLSIMIYCKYYTVFPKETASVVGR